MCRESKSYRKYFESFFSVRVIVNEERKIHEIENIKQETKKAIVYNNNKWKKKQQQNK